jgi:hypothetical protein
VRVGDRVKGERKGALQGAMLARTGAGEVGIAEFLGGADNIDSYGPCAEASDAVMMTLPVAQTA